MMTVCSTGIRTCQNHCDIMHKAPRSPFKASLGPEGAQELPGEHVFVGALLMHVFVLTRQLYLSGMLTLFLILSRQSHWALKNESACEDDVL